jgi:hypothetical protein
VAEVAGSRRMWLQVAEVADLESRVPERQTSRESELRVGGDGGELSWTVAKVAVGGEILDAESWGARLWLLSGHFRGW